MSVGRGFATFTQTIADTQSAAAFVPLNGMAPKRLLIPTGTEGTHIGFDHSDDQGVTVYASRDDAGSLIAIPFQAGAALELSPGLYAGSQWIRIKTFSNSAGTAQTQTGDALIKMIAI